NEEPIKDFEDEETTGELINRLQNEDIYYVGWCSDDNKEESQEFLLKNDLKGILVNVDDSDTDTLSEQIGKIADTVVERYQEESGIQMDGDAVVVNKGSDVVLTVSGASASNTADEEYPDGKWIVQSYDTTGTLISTTTTSNLSPDFTNAGKYLIYYKVADSVHLVKTIVINDAPDASFQVAVASQGAISASLTNTSTDAEGGTLTSVWKYLEVASGGAFTVLPQDASQNAVLTPMEQGKLYLVALTVTDVWGVSSTVSQQVSYDVTQSALPIADFSLSTHKIVRNATGEAISGSNLIQVKDKSYDIYGRSITSSFSCATGAGFTIDPATGTNGTYTIDTTSLSAGTYAVYLTANNGVNTSNRVARFFTIVVDQEGPTVTASPKAGAITEGNADVQISFLDEGSGFLKAKALVTTSNTAPTEEAWNALPYQYNNTYTTSFANQEGTYYIHYLVVDKLGNKTISYVGPYEVDLIAPTVAKIVSPVKGDKQVAVAPVIEWNMSESVKKGEGYLYIRRASDDAVVYTVAAASNTVRISGNVVRVNPLVTLDNNETYYVSLTKGFVKDASDNPLAALDGKESWSFTTKKAQDEVKANEIQIVGVTVTQKLFDGAGGTQTTQTKAQPGVGANTFLVYVYDTSTSDATIQVNVAPEYSVTPRNTELSVNTGNANINYTQNKDGSYDITVPASVSATDKTVTFTVKGETYTISFVSLGAKWQKVSSKVVKYGAWATGDWISADKINLENAVDISDVADNSHDVVVNVELVANTDLSAISSTDMAALTASIGGNLKFLDLTMVKSVTTDSGTPVETQIHNTLVPIKVTLTLPESLQGGYDIGVYRLHDGVIAKLGASLSEDSKQVSFESDAYSTYAIQYTEQSGGTTNVKNTDVEIPISYETTNPKDLSVPLETGKSLKKIVWNGTMLSSDFYEISKGELTLKKEAVDGMADGTYPLVVMYTDNTSFTYTLEVVAYDKTKTVTDVPVFHLVKNMSEGNRFSFTFTGVKSNASVSYASSNSKVISVTSDGTITAVKNGMATVTATIAQKGSLYQVKLKVKVQDGMPFNRTVSKDAAVTVSTSLPVFNIYKRVSLGNKTKIRLEQVAEDAVVTYTSDNTGVASVSKSGVIKGIGAGNCIVSVKIRQNDKTYCYKILVITE
ncbi:MAG: hypothetical protein PWP24_760, partial [Clostridiales bacterium]|nr:hypothetical protein [Clostridiales bacterium]